MSLQYLGGASVGGAMPALAAAIAQLNLAIGLIALEKAKLNAQLSLLLQVHLPDIASLTAAATLALPSLAVSLPTLPSAAVTVNGDLIAQIGLIDAQIAGISAALGFAAALTAPGLHLYGYDGAVSGLGPALSSTLGAGLPGGSGPGARGNALVVATESPAAWTALGAVVKTTP